MHDNSYTIIDNSSCGPGLVSCNRPVILQRKDYSSKRIRSFFVIEDPVIFSPLLQEEVDDDLRERQRIALTKQHRPESLLQKSHIASVVSFKIPELEHDLQLAEARQMALGVSQDEPHFMIPPGPDMSGVGAGPTETYEVEDEDADSADEDAVASDPALVAAVEAFLERFEEEDDDKFAGGDVLGALDVEQLWRSKFSGEAAGGTVQSKKGRNFWF